MEMYYFKNILEITAKNALYGITSYYERNNYNNINTQLYYLLEDSIYDGNFTDIYGHDVELADYGMEEGYTVNVLLQTMTEKFERAGFDVKEIEVILHREGLRQIDPWNLYLEADFFYDFSDIAGIVSWRGYSRENITIPITGFYAFDYESLDNNAKDKENFGKITEEWIVDEEPYTEPSFLSKMNNDDDPDPGLGLCSPDFGVAGIRCDAD